MEQKGIGLTILLRNAIKVVTSPRVFFREMPKTGGYQEPLLFLIIMGAATGIVTAVLGLLGLATIFSTGMAVLAIIVTPVLFVAFGFLGSAVAYAVWRALGSKEPYEASFRCVAFIAASMPIVAALDAIPYVGWIAVVGWVTFLYATAGIESHKISARMAWLVFGIIGVAVLFLGLGTEFGVRSERRSAERKLQEMQRQVEELQKKTESK